MNIDIDQAMQIAEACLPIATEIAEKTKGQPGIFAPREQACVVLMHEVKRQRELLRRAVDGAWLDLADKLARLEAFLDAPASSLGDAKQTVSVEDVRAVLRGNP